MSNYETDPPIRYVARWIIDDGSPDEELDPASFEYSQSARWSLKEALDIGEHNGKTYGWYEVREEVWAPMAYEGIGGWEDTGRYWIDGIEHHE